mmetsp:Transcript_3526/g.2981  ORF Transcript_3526/g.2981 Transcript_3526/m.2981 type:complete len:84 (-) Transcript_3526:1235-1486(-)
MYKEQLEDLKIPSEKTGKKLKKLIDNRNDQISIKIDLEKSKKKRRAHSYVNPQALSQKSDQFSEEIKLDEKNLEEDIKELFKQ